MLENHDFVTQKFMKISLLIQDWWQLAVGTKVDGVKMILFLKSYFLQWSHRSYLFPGGAKFQGIKPGMLLRDNDYTIWIQLIISLIIMW